MIYHITTADEWVQALNSGVYKAKTLKTEGFMHCSTEAQVMKSANKHFADQNELIVLHIVERRIPKGELRYEAAKSGEEFPHVYSQIEIAVVEDQSILVKNEKGEFEWIKPTN